LLITTVEKLVDRKGEESDNTNDLRFLQMPNSLQQLLTRHAHEIKFPYPHGPSSDFTIVLILFRLSPAGASDMLLNKLPASVFSKLSLGHL